MTGQGLREIDRNDTSKESAIELAFEMSPLRVNG
jgi:hypothetical protein